MEKLGHDQIGDGVVNRRAEEDDAVLEQPAIDVEVALTPAGLLEDGWDYIVLGTHSSSSTTSAINASTSMGSASTTSASTSVTCKLNSIGLPSSSTGLAFEKTTSNALFRRISLARANSRPLSRKARR